MNFTDVFRSIQETGGASFNINSGEMNPEKGYMVPLSKKNEAKYVIPANLADFATIVKAYISEHYDDLMDGSWNTFLGFWIHDGWLYVDRSQNIKDFEEAYQAGFDREQIAIYDCAKKRDITITYLYPY